MTMEIEDKINLFIGKPYHEVNFNCWTLIEEIVPNAPKIKAIGNNFSKAIKEFKSKTPEYENLFNEILENPESLDIILAGNNYINHAGILIKEDNNFLVLHNDKEGVHIEPAYRFIKKYKTTRIMRCKPE